MYVNVLMIATAAVRSKWRLAMYIVVLSPTLGRKQAFVCKPFMSGMLAHDFKQCAESQRTGRARLCPVLADALWKQL